MLNYQRVMTKIFTKDKGTKAATPRIPPQQWPAPAGSGSLAASEPASHKFQTSPVDLRTSPSCTMAVGIRWLGSTAGFT